MPAVNSNASPATIPPHISRYLQGPTDVDRQFDFLIGDWDVQATKFDPDGATLARYRATWCAKYLNDGRMLMDNFQALAPDGRPISAFVTLRTYSMESRRWEMAGLGAMQTAAAVEWYGTWTDGEMHVIASGEDPSGRLVQTRIRFSDITPEHFLWTSECSVDGGTSWARTAALVANRAVGESSR